MAGWWRWEARWSETRRWDGKEYWRWGLPVDIERGMPLHRNAAALVAGKNLAVEVSLISVRVDEKSSSRHGGRSRHGVVRHGDHSRCQWRRTPDAQVGKADGRLDIARASSRLLLLHPSGGQLSDGSLLRRIMTFLTVVYFYKSSPTFLFIHRCCITGFVVW